jgi:hypothetical protein
MTYLGYLLRKLTGAWKEDKFQFFCLFWIVSIFIGPICLIINQLQFLSFPDSTLNSTPNMIFTPLGVIGLSLTGYAFIFTFIMAIPEIGTYLSWTLAIIKLPYTIPRWLYRTIRESYNNYKNQKIAS